MKVLHFRRKFSLPSETFIYDLICNLEDCGIDNYVLTDDISLTKERPFPKVIKIKRISFFRRVYNKIFMSLDERKKARQNIYIDNIAKYINKLSPDVIHAHFGIEGTEIYSALKKHNLNIPIIVAFHGYDVNVLPKKDEIYLSQLLELNTDKMRILFTSPSRFLKNKLISLGMNENKIHIIHNSYNQYFKNIKRKSYWQYGKEFRLLNIGRFVEVKGQKYLIRAFAKLIEKYPNSTLTMIGYGDLESELRAMCVELGLSNKVIFLLQVEHTKIPEIMIRHDVYVQSSIVAEDGAEENLSVSTIEAQVCGLPSVVSNIGGLKEIVIDNVTGMLVEQKNDTSIFSTLEYYIDNPNTIKEHSINAAKHAKEKFNKSEITKQTIKLYNNI